MQLWLQFSETKKNNRVLINKNEKLNTDLSDARSEIQRLETLLAPFRTVALERYTGPEAEALRKLSDQIRELESKDTEKTRRIEELEKDLEVAQKKIATPILSLVSKEVQERDNEWTCALRFSPSKNEPLGIIVFIVELPRNSSSIITDFTPKGAHQHGKDSKRISEDRKTARLAYSLLGVGSVRLELKVSDPSPVKISGNYIPEPLIFEVK